MECNKEEAVRAKGIAEKKMQNKDFMGAQKMALKAQQLFPDLENISQMLTVCDVHCSAEHKIFGSEMDWYGILQVEQMTDEASIKKQYRKLALLLHPDKNKFAGAEAAFKLIGEAHRVLSDQATRSLHDMKRKAAPLRTVTSKQTYQQPSRNSYVRKQPAVQNNNAAAPQFTSFHPHHQQQQHAQPGFSNRRQTFWTVCPFCRIRYQYYRDIVNKALRCQSCKKPFIAYDIDAQGTPTGTNCSQSVFPQQKDVTGQGAHKVDPQTTSSEPLPKRGSTSEVGGESKTKVKDGKVDIEYGMEGVKRPKFEVKKPEESKPSGSTSRKRGRTSVEASDSYDIGSRTDTEEDGGLPAGQSSRFTPGQFPRRSPRQKQNVAYNENVKVDDSASPQKRPRGRWSGATDEEGKEASLKVETSKTDKPFGCNAVLDEEKKENKQKGRDPLEESIPNGKDEEECKANEKEAAAVNASKERSKVDENSKSNSSPKTPTNPEYYSYSDPEFSDFDKDRKEECFAVGQMWAVYDTVGAMPRFYARIRKVFAPGFKLRITWLEADPDDKDDIDWLNEDLPIACGKFKHGSSENTEDRLMFSHLVFWEKGSSRGSYKIYPRKGETWALFKNWDIKWNSDPDNHRQYQFEFVEVLSEYVEGIGISVSYLGKMKEFVSLFRRMRKEEMVSFVIPPSELFRFSHRVPSFRMTGMEREDVPEGSFELDPASLPTNLEEFEFAPPEDDKLHTESMNATVSNSGSKPVADEVKPMTKPKTPNTAKRSIDLDDKNALERGNLKCGNRSPRELNEAHKMPGQANASQCAANGEGSKHLDGTKNRSPDDFTRVVESASTDEKEMHLDAKETSSDSVTIEPSPPPASSPEAYEIPEAEFYDFDADKSQEKFQPGQIWALYSDEDGLPKYYARIKKIESQPDFKLHITWLEACSPPKEAMQWLDKDMPVGCGKFMLSKGKSNEYSATNSFSHQLRVEPNGKNRYAIYPRIGEIWALYRNWNAGWVCSDLENCEYDIVEVIEDNNLGKKVLVLIVVNGFKSVYKAQREGEAVVTMEIPSVELIRFSHRIPAFLITEERNGSLRGCWELDPASMPFRLLCSD
ncbi:hypothetical protein HHK36_026601 [Tetracentron sinense]|uniref:J domain-containing protein n=1 Tax=Tetracentron sinense TaxID=13715 RepID=A0A834YJR7_TETSI|nr:hypothetical protein HHK36_026601 [Tetracentron sinense]